MSGFVLQFKSNQDFVGWFPLSIDQRGGGYCAVLMDGHSTNYGDVHPQVALTIFKSIDKYRHQLSLMQDEQQFREWIKRWYIGEIFFNPLFSLNTSTTNYGACVDIMIVTQTQTFLFHHGDTRVYIKLRARENFYMLPEYNDHNPQEFERIGKKHTALRTTRSIGDFGVLPKPLTIDNKFFPFNDLCVQVYKNTDLEYILCTTDGFFETPYTNTIEMKPLLDTLNSDTTKEDDILNIIFKNGLHGFINDVDMYMIDDMSFLYLKYEE